MIGIDLFAGAGGMSLGASMAGITVKEAVEFDQYAAMTYSHNHKGVRLFQGDIRRYHRPRDWRPKEQVVVFGGPPCQGFSTSNQRTRTKENPNNWLFEEYLRVVKEFQADWIVFENVRGIVETEGGFFVERVLNRLSKLGYSVVHGVLNAQDFGVPQNRSRFFIVGSLHGEEAEWPRKKSGRLVTVSDAISDLPRLSNGWSEEYMSYRSAPKSSYARSMRGKLQHSHNHLVTRNARTVLERYSYVPPGGNWESIPARFMKNYRDRSRCHTGIYHRLAPNKPSVVVGNFRKNMLIHPSEDRGLSIREAARLQSFPDWFEFRGSIGFQQQQVGNSVPPLLGFAVFQPITNISDGREVTFCVE